MIDGHWFEIAVLLSMVYVSYTDTRICKEKIEESVKYVTSCPKNKEDWDRKDFFKNCSSIQEQCTDVKELFYHCVINTPGNETLEVCAPKAQIVENSCAEYNVLGAVIQPNPYFNCNPSCPGSYESTEAYKFQECYKNVSRKHSTEESTISFVKTNATAVFSSNTSSSLQEDCRYAVSGAWQTVAFLMIAVNVFFLILIILLSRGIFFKWKQAKENNKNGNGEECEEMLIHPQNQGSNGQRTQKNLAQEESDIQGGPEREDNKEVVTCISQMHGESGEDDNGAAVITHIQKEPERNDKEAVVISHIQKEPERNDNKVFDRATNTNGKQPKKSLENTGVEQSDRHEGSERDDNKELYVVGVDIGDNFVTMALSIEQFPTRIPILGERQRISLLSKTKGEAFSCEVFGGEAFRQYMENKSADFTYHDGIRLSNECTEPIIYSETIKQILHYLYLEIDHKLDENQRKLVHYAFVVSRCWSGNAKDKLREEIVRNKIDKLENIDENHIHIIQREQTLLPCIHEVKARVSYLNFNVDNLKPSDKPDVYSYAVLHIGSTYCDLAFLKDVDDEDPIRFSQTGPEIWNKLPKDHLREYLVDIYGNDTVNRWESKKKKDSISLTYAFEKQLTNRDINTSNGIAFEIHLPDSLSLEKTKNKNDKRVDGKTKKIKITHDFFKKFFKTMTDKVKSLIKSEEFFLKGVSCVIMTGTYSKLELIWDKAEEKWFKNRSVTIAIPENVHVFAMGAAYCVRKIKRPRFSSGMQLPTMD